MTTEEVTAVHTHHGKRVDFANIRPADICLEDIAWSLAGQNRWTAHGNFPWFVTDHSLLVHRRVCEDPLSTPIDKLQALTHDMHEAYESDLNHPLKVYLSKHTDVLAHLEARLDRTIRIALGISHLPVSSDLVRHYDISVRNEEYQALFSTSNVKNTALPRFGDRSTQATRAAYFLGTVTGVIAEALRHDPLVKFTVINHQPDPASKSGDHIRGMMREAAQSIMPTIKRMPRSWLERPKPTVQKLMEALSTFQKENPDIKATLTFE